MPIAMPPRAMALALLLAAPACPVLAQDGAVPPAPEFLGQIVVPSGLSIGGVTFGGISDLTYDAAGDRYLAISDDRAEHGPARFYDLRIAQAEGIVSLDIAAMHELTLPGGESIGAQGVDGEGIAFDGTRLFWSSERDADGVPGIFVADAAGLTETAITLPAAYLPDAEGTRGVYSNLAFEGLALSADASQLIVGTENALAQDGAKATLEAGSPARLLVIDTATLAPVAEYIYPTETIFAAATVDPFWNDNGLSAIEALPDGRLVVVERSFALGLGNLIRVYVADVAGATNVLGQDPVDVTAVQAVAKTSWFQIGEGDFGLDIDNVESFAFGPVVDGQQVFVIASDDNFNPESQFTQFALFTIPAL